jgi:tetratricopeptide (TPR) repeat protein
MQGNIRRFFAAFAIVLTTSGAASAQMQGGADWDAAARQFGGGQGGATAPSAARNATLDELNKILSTSQLPAVERSVYLSIRAFQLSRLGREADSQKDIAEMGKVLPNAWQLVLSTTMPGLAGGGDRAAALRMLDYGLRRKPNDPSLMVAQAKVYMQLADFSRALAMLDGSVAASTTPADRRSALYARGHANLNLGNFQQAAADFDSSLAGLTTVKARIAPLLWRYAAQVHTKQDARAILGKDLGNENLYEWPGPIAKFLLGKLPAGELEVAAESDEAAKRSNGKCPAAFFVGMDAVRRGDKQRAREQLQLAQARCPTVSDLNWAASSELKRL